MPLSAAYTIPGAPFVRNVGGVVESRLRGLLVGYNWGVAGNGGMGDFVRRCRGNGRGGTERWEDKGHAIPWSIVVRETQMLLSGEEQEAEVVFLDIDRRRARMAVVDEGINRSQGIVVKMAKVVSVRRYAAMSDEIEQLDVELNELLSSVRNDIESDPRTGSRMGCEESGDDIDREERRDFEAEEPAGQSEGDLPKLQSTESSLRMRHHSNLMTIQVEMRELDRDELRKYEGSARKHQSTLDELNRNLNYAKSLVEKAELMGDRDQNPTSAADGKNAKELIEMAKQTQVTDVEAMMRMQRMINESEETGMETNIKLKTQTEQLKNIHADVHTVSARMRTAEKLVNQIGRRLATDKLIACIILILVALTSFSWPFCSTSCKPQLLLILAIIVVKALGLDQKGTAQVVGAGGYVYYIDCNLFQNFYPQCQSTPAPSPGPTPAPSGETVPVGQIN
eukprot:719490-Hanusia_phi.AAC.8